MTGYTILSHVLRHVIYRDAVGGELMKFCFEWHWKLKRASSAMWAWLLVTQLFTWRKFDMFKHCYLAR